VLTPQAMLGNCRCRRLQKANDIDSSANFLIKS